MSRTRSSIHAIRRAGILLPLLIAAAFALSVVGSLYSSLDNTKKASIPFPVPVYEIKAVSGTHTASLLNLPIGQPGIPQVPMPVDVDGDLLPDVTVAVNLVNVQGLFNNPPNIGAILAPNIEIDRLVTATTLGQKSPPLNIQVQLRVIDLQGQQPDTTASFGYDTGEGGSIPMHWKATVGGLQSFFNPVEAVVDTEGMILTGISLPGSPSAYQGPLSLVAAVNHQPLQANVDLRYDPWPNAIHVTYGTDSAGQHITYAHDYAGETDVVTKAHLQDGSGTTDATATIERMPRSIALDLNMAGGGGTIDWRADSDGRLPDIQALLSQQPNSGRPTNVRADIEALPAVMHGEWAMGGSNMSAKFTSSGQGIGAVEAQITNYNGASPPGLGFIPYVPTRRQYANFQQSGGNDPNRLIAARVEKIRDATFNKTATGVAGNIGIGDGEQPLEVHGFLADLNGRDIDATSVISPLPDRIKFAMDAADPHTSPFAVSYDASDPLDVDVHATVRATGVNDACGVGLTICADLKLRNIPPHIDASLKRADDQMLIDVNDLPNLNGGSPPDVFADVTTGPDVIPALGTPLVAHAEILGLPSHVRARVVQPADGSPSRAEFHTCNFDYGTAACIPDSYPQTDIAALTFNVRNTLLHDATVPVLRPSAPNYVTVAGQGSKFEIAGSMTHISQLVYAKHDGLTGFRTEIGGGKDLQVLADVRNFDPNVFAPPGPGDDPQPTLDIKANLTVSPLPATLDICMRENGNAIPTTPSNDVTAVCESVDPFGLGNDNDLSNSPMTVAYTAASPFNILTDATLVQHGVPVDGGDPSNVAVADRTLHGVVNVTNIPSHFVANILTPPEGRTGAIRARYDTDDNTANEPMKQIGVHFEASMNEGNLVCSDPRIPAKGFNSLCVSGDINDIPTAADFVLDQTKQNDNLHLKTTGEHKMSLTNLHLASVAGTGDNLKAQVLVADGSVIGLPDEVRGTLVLPGSFDLTSPSGNLIDEIHLKVRDYIAPDPLPDAPPDQRTRYLDPTHAQLDPATQQILFFMQDDLFKGIVDIKDVKGAGFLTSRDNAGNLLDTNLVKVDFGVNQTLRAYADLRFHTTPGDESTLVRVNGDITLEDLPAAMQVCFRGKNQHPGVAVSAASMTWCDDKTGSTPNIPDDKGGIQFLATPKTLANVDSDDTLDVDATVRVAAVGQVLAGRVRVDNIPNVIQGTFGDGTVDIGGYKKVGTSLVPDGIDRIAVDAANADIIDDGYGPNAPWGQRDQSTVAPLPNPTYPQYVQLGAKSVGGGIDFHARASIGAIEGAGNPAGSDLQHILIDKQACGRPGTQAQYPDYPYYPTGDGVSTYTCARVDFEQVNSEQTNDPMELTAIVDRDGTHAELRDAGIDNLPAFVQLNLASTQTLNGDGTLRPRCGALTTVPHPAGCMPPLVRLDTPVTTTSTLFGQLKYGTPAELDQLTDVHPHDGAIPNNFYDVSPGITGSSWNDWFASSPAGFPKALGIRAKVATFDDGDVAAKVGLRIQIPQSLTVDQVQSWSSSAQTPVYYDASDFNFHYRVSNPQGTVGAVGQLAGLLQLADGTQITIGGGGVPNALNTLDPKAGLPLPGEIGLAMYQRNNKGSGQQLVQIDGRISDPGGTNSPLPSGTPMTVRARLFGSADSILGEVDASVNHIPTRPNNDTTGRPSFRLRAEILGSGSSPPGDGSGAGVASAQAPAECSFLLCTKVDIKVKKVLVHFDFKPTSGPAARLLEAVVRTDGSKNGLQVKGWDEIADTPGHPLQPAKYDVGADVYVDPLNVFFHAGIPILGSIDFALVSDLHVGVHIRETSDFAARQNIVKISTDNNGAGSRPSDIVFAMNIYVLHGIAFSILGIFLGDPVLFSVDYVFPPPLLFPFYDCSDPFTPAGTLAGNIASLDVNDPFFPGASDGSTSIFDQLTGAAVNIPAGHRDFVAWPVNGPPQFIFGGSLGLGLNGLIKLGPPIFCTFGTSDTDIPLIHGTPATPHTGDPATKAPDDPLNLLGHNVPGLTGAEVSLTKYASAASSATAASADLTLSNVSDYCGEVTGNNITLNGTITASNVTNGGHCIGAGNVGSLTILADGDVTVNGTVVGGNGGTVKLQGNNITVNNGASVHAGHVVVFTNGLVTMNGNASLDASNVVSSSNASGNSGGGHGGAGGNGSVPSGGPASGNTNFNVDSNGEVSTDSGFAGSSAGGGAAGTGGGTVKLTADHLQMNGTSAIRVNGQAGGNDTTGACGHPAGPSNMPPLLASTGARGGGGGAGGGIVLNATQIDIPAGTSLSAVGGGGGTGNLGAGGGGGGGIVKVITPVLHLGGGIGVGGGGAGSTPCFDTPGGSGGAGGQFLPLSAPASRVVSDPNNPVDLWHNTTSITVPYTAASGNYDGDNQFTVYLCGTFADASHVHDINFGVANPTGSAPCGNGTQLGHTTVTGERSPANATITNNDTPTVNGFYGLYTVVKNDDSFFCAIFGACDYESLPGGPDTIIGVDQVKPVIAISSANTTVAKTTVTMTINVTESLPSGSGPVAGLSGLAKTQCSNDDVNFTTCGTGTVGWTIPDGDGVHTVYVKATDIAGNVNESSINFTLDGTAPTSVLTSPSAGSLSGWLLGPPSSFTMTGNADTHHIDWWFDGGGHTSCSPGLVCTVTGSVIPNNGAHSLHWQAVDSVGNMEAPHDQPFKIDADKPLVALLTVPTSVDGANGWFQENPFFVINAVDIAGGSGVNGITYKTRPAGVGAYSADIPYGGPFQLGPGEWDVCIKSQDLAGNPAIPSGDGVIVGGLNNGCRLDVKIDNARPTLTLQTLIGATPSAPNGDNGWFTTSPVVRATATDATPGSQVAGIFASVDHKPYDFYTGDIPIPEGLHEVRAYSVDGSGQQSDVAILPVKVDLSPAEPAARTVPIDPARNGWFRRPSPAFVLRAQDGDQNAGTRKIVYQLVAPTAPVPSVCNALWTTYPGQLTTVVKGPHRVDYCAIDESGRMSTVRSKAFNIDPDNTIVKALQAQPNIWFSVLGVLGPPTTDLKWEVTEPTSSKVTVSVVVYNLLGVPVRQINEPTARTVTPGVTLSGSTAWDGKDNTLLGIVPAGVYYYRVIVTDDAGNTSMSGESKPITIKVKIL